jgi:uncharacterized repeat protein (TIGR03943 family)
MQFQTMLPWLDALAMLSWGVLFLKYWLTGKLNRLIHPDYAWLAIVGGIGLLGFGGWRTWQLLQNRRTTPAQAHITLLPPGWGSVLLLITAIVGLSTTPRTFSSQTAFQRGVMDTVALTRTQPQAFRATIRPEERNLIDWVRTVNTYPEPDAYTGQKVNVQGFVIHPPELSEEYFLISRFVITCCAADVYPIGLPVKLAQSRRVYPADSWLQVEGQMITETVGGKRQLTIQAAKLTPIPEPKNPYEY